MTCVSIVLFLAAAQQPARGGVSVWDTGEASPRPLAAGALAERKGWTAVAEAAEFKGDVVLSNGRIAAAFRRESGAVEVYDGTGLRLRLVLAGAAERLEKASVVENTRGAACVEATYRASGGGALSAKFRLKRGDVAVEVEPGAGAEALRLECDARFVVLPDFFADDMLFDARRLALDSIEVPSDNFILHLAGKGGLLVMGILESRDREVKVALSGPKEERVFASSELPFGAARKRVWAAVLSAPEIWHAFDVQVEEGKKGRPPERALDWKMPFPAQWRCDFTRSDELTDSWEMLLPKKSGDGYLKPTWMGSDMEELPKNRRRWTTVLGDFPYPCWSDREGRGNVQPLRHPALTFKGPAVLYPIHRMPDTPLDRFTVIDVARNALGTGPCEYILDLEGQRPREEGWATCYVRDKLQPVYKSGQQKRKRNDVEKALRQGHVFVTTIRARIEAYMEFGRNLREYLAEETKKRPELAEALAPLEKIAADLEVRYEARREKMKTPDHVKAMNEEFRKNVLDYEGDDAFDRCKAYTKALVEIGDNQDELVGECRWTVRALRQRAGILRAVDPRAAGVAEEIRTRTQAMLRAPTWHEGPRH